MAPHTDPATLPPGPDRILAVLDAIDAEVANAQ